MSLNVEQIETGQAARIEKAERPKAANGEGFAALLATLSAELRTFSGVSPEMALPTGAAKPANTSDDYLPRNAEPDIDHGSGQDDADRGNDPAAGLRSAESRGRSRSEGSEDQIDRDARSNDRPGPADDGARSAQVSDDGAGETADGTRPIVAANARGAEQHAAPGSRNGAAAQLPTGQAGTPQAIAEEFKALAAARQATAPNQSGAYKPTAGAGGNQIRAAVVDQGPGLASQPNASLAASATVNAQLGRGNKPNSTGLNDGGLSLDDGRSLRGDLRSVPGTVKPTTPGAVKAASPDAAAGDAAGRSKAGQQAPLSAAMQAAPAMQTQAANAATSQGSLGQAGPPSPGQVADTAMATSGSPNQNQAPARTRPTGFTGHMRSAAQSAPTAEQIAIQIQRAIGTGTDRITIQLRPQELGRVEVKMEVGHDGKLLAVISADKPETLDLLQRDQRSLQDALSNAGLDLDSNSLSFNLNGHDDGQTAAGDDGDGSKTGAEEDDLGRLSACRIRPCGRDYRGQDRRPVVTSTEALNDGSYERSCCDTGTGRTEQRPKPVDRGFRHVSDDPDDAASEPGSTVAAGHP